MPIGVRIDLPGASLEWYDEVLATTGFLPGGPMAKGGLCHWVTKTEDGICIVEVWESREAFESDAKIRSPRVVREVGVPGQPVITFFEVYNYLPGR